ncbi:MAG TPA: hypothetical protein VLW52_07375 [Opitutaceae bacterium]|nr:hypothetical protein [Opitutaceae bacterium]
MNTLQTLLARLPPRSTRWMHRLISAGLGVLTATILHYVLFRIALPSKPFIYVAF